MIIYVHLATLSILLVNCCFGSVIPPEDTSDEIYDEYPLKSNDKLKVITRSDWNARTPEHRISRLVHPLPFVIIMNAGYVNCTDLLSCSMIVKSLQSVHIDVRKWYDITYNFLVGGDGMVYEGRGWNVIGAHSFAHNNRSVGIAFIGKFQDVKPPEIQITAAQQLIKDGVKAGYITEDYRLVAASQLQPIQSPGKMLFEDIKTWDHWSENIY